MSAIRVLWLLQFQVELALLLSPLLEEFLH